MPPEIFTSDASPFGMGATVTDVAPPVAQEFFRRRECRGHYTQLYSDDAATLLERGHADAEDFDRSVFTPLKVLAELDDVVELCCGPRSVLLDACLNKGMRCGPRIDISQHNFGTSKLHG